MQIHVDDLMSKFIKEVYLEGQKEDDVFFIDTKKKYVIKYLRASNQLVIKDNEILNSKHEYKKLRLKFDLTKGFDWLFYKLYLKIQKSVNIMGI